jgi:ABC-type multidrug transport system fused ATPase/permease subunit
MTSFVPSSAVLKPHEKVGICGRTGAGKSSLISALYRLADVQEGDVIIDGINIADISLQELRSRLAIIPQEPTLFSGTIRRNLDPMDEVSDEDVWNALDMVSLKTVMQRKPEGLDAPVTEGGVNANYNHVAWVACSGDWFCSFVVAGENWSHGQRQLICMARALLKRSKVVILDEATAACDVETDAILQRTIRRAFADSTVLTIAHRVHTILDSDRIMVLDQGRIVEFDTPKKLLSNPASQFSRLLAESATASGEVASARPSPPSV